MEPPRRRRSDPALPLVYSKGMNRRSACLLLGGVPFATPQLSKSQTPQGLRIVNPVIHDRREDGPTISPTYQFIPGELLYLSFRIAGFQRKADRADVRWQLILTDPEGQLLLPALNGAIREEVADHDVDWMPKIQQIIPLPPQLPSGTFKIKIRIADEFGSTSADQTLEFKVRGRSIESVPALTIMQLAFYRNEADRAPLEPPTFAPGTPLFGRFELLGFKLGEKNRFDVEYGIFAYRPSGKLLYSEPKAASEQDSPFYPKRFLVGGFTLNLSNDLSAGEYTVEVKAKDNVGGTETSLRATFKVEK
jgi:hypothetical protein